MKLIIRAGFFMPHKISKCATKILQKVEKIKNFLITSANKMRNKKYLKIIWIDIIIITIKSSLKRQNANKNFNFTFY